MKIEIRLKKILKESDEGRHGVEKRIADALGLHRNTIGKLFRNESPNPSLEVLGKVCDWLRDHANVPAKDLPGALFGFHPSGLWPALAALGQVTTYLGEYRQTVTKTRQMLWVSRHDAIVEDHIVRALSTYPNPAWEQPTFLAEYVPFRFTPVQQDTKTKEFDQDIETARKIFLQMRTNSSRSTAVLIGSQRTNYMVEHLVGDLFGCRPFPESPSGRHVPFHLSFQGSDRLVRSCFGGAESLPGLKGPLELGTYYRDKNDEWVCCPWIPDKEDAGAIITLYDPGTKGMDLVVFGFSGRGTEAIGRQLLQDASQFWPPDDSKVESKARKVAEPKVESKAPKVTEPEPKSGGRRVAVYICRFTMEVQAGETFRSKDFQVIPIAKTILEKYLP